MLADSDRRYLDLLKRCLTASIYDESAWLAVTTSLQARAEVRDALSPLRVLVTSLLKRAHAHSLMLVHPLKFDLKMRENGRDWPMFGYSMIGHRRLENLQFCIEDVVQRGVAGDLVETGVWRGGAVIFMRAVLKALESTDRTVWACDSFEGLPAPKNATDGQDLSRVNFLHVSLEQVKDNFRRFDLLDDQVKFIKGWFCDSLPNAPIEKIAVLRLDGDMYSSTMDALDALYDRVAPGGYVIVDDYFSWPSCKQAVTDFLKKRKLSPEIVTIDWSGAFWQVSRGLNSE